MCKLISSSLSLDMFLFPTPVLVLSWKNRFFLGSNKVLQIALGRTAADELKEDLHKVTEV